MKLKEITKDYRPREKLIFKGVASLSDPELLAVILEKGISKINVLDLSNKLLHNGFSGLKKKSYSELKKVRGIGDAKACKILALAEIARRMDFRMESVIIKSPRDVFDYFHPRLKDLEQEHFYVLLLNSKNQVVAEELVAVGINNAVLVHPREVFKKAIRASANAIILVHNHPSGDPAPSEEDIKITDTLVESGDLLHIKVLDHIIIGQEDFRSVKM